MVRLRAIALAAVLVVLTSGYAVAQQRSVWNSNTVIMAAAADEQIEIRMVGGCNSNVAVQVVLMAELKGVIGNRSGPFNMTVAGNPVPCGGASGSYTVGVSLNRNYLPHLERLRLEAKGAWDIIVLTAVVSSSDDDYFDS